jgi:hypothetical protein
MKALANNASTLLVIYQNRVDKASHKCEDAACSDGGRYGHRWSSPRCECRPASGARMHEGPLPPALTSKGSGPMVGSLSPGSSSGRTPALTSQETYVRIVDRGPESGTSRRCLQRPAPKFSTWDWPPSVNLRRNIATLDRLCHRIATGRSRQAHGLAPWQTLSPSTSRQWRSAPSLKDARSAPSSVSLHSPGHHHAAWRARWRW